MGTTYRKAIVTLRKRYGQCVNDETLQNVAVSREVITKLPPAHRPKPTPLDLTALGFQQTEVRDYGHHVDVTSGLYGGCFGTIGPTPFTQEIHTWVQPPVTNPVCDDPNWMLALRGKILDDKVSFAETIGEWREAIRMVEDAASALKKAWKAVKTLWRLRKARRWWRRWFIHTFGREPTDKFELMDAIQVDLAIKFGIKPLANLAWDTAEQLNRYLLRTRRLQVTMKRKVEASYAGPYGGAYNVVVEKSYRAIAFVTYDMDSRGFTSGNLGEALWAGTRLSFMLDWWINISSYLASFSATRGVTSLKGVLCKRERRTGTDTRVLTPKGQMRRQGKMIYKSYSREVFNNIPYADFPDGANPDSDLLKRLLSALEILLTLRKARLLAT